MPVYISSFDLETSTKTSLPIHVLNYINPPDPKPESSPKKKGKQTKGPKQLICSSACMYLGTKNMTSIDEEDQREVLVNGQVYEGYYVRTITGSYDYCYKIWTDRRLPFPPLNYPTPNEEDSNELIIIDRNNDFFGLACGPHLAFCRGKALEAVGVNLKNMTFPQGGVIAKLHRLGENRPAEIPYAAFEAIPVVPKEEILEEEEVKVEIKEEREISKEGIKEVKIEKGDAAK